VNTEKEDALAKANEAREERNKSRVEMMEAIADSSEQHREHEEQLEVKDDAAEAEARAAAEAAKKLQTEGVVDDEVKTERIPPESDEKLINGVTHYLQVVNGQERWMTLKQIRETAQKVDSADEYLRQASDSVRNAARVALSPQKDVPTKLAKGELADLLRRQALGEDEAIEKLASYYEGLSSSQEDILPKIDQRLSLRTELAQLQTENKDLLDDPYLGELFQARLARMQREAPTTPLAEAYGKIGKELRDRFGTSLKPDKTAEKLERKRTLVNPPTAAARQLLAEEPEGDEEAGHRDAIKAMAAARQPRPNPATPRRQ
jgi:hypothetical protein